MFGEGKRTKFSHKIGMDDNEKSVKAGVLLFVPGQQYANTSILLHDVHVLIAYINCHTSYTPGF